MMLHPERIRSCLRALVISGLVLLGVLAPIPADAQPVPGRGAWRRALLSHTLPLRPAQDPGRARPDTVGAYDLVLVEIAMDFDGPALPTDIRYEITIESRERIVDGFALLAAFFEPLAIREVGGAELDFNHSAELGELVVFLDRPIPVGVTRRYVIDAELTYRCDTPPACSDERFLHVTDAAWYPMSLSFPFDDRFQVRLVLSAPDPDHPTGTGVRVGPERRVDGRNEAIFITERPTILPAFAIGPYRPDLRDTIEIFSPPEQGFPGAEDNLVEIARTSRAVYDDLFGRFPFGRLGITAIDAAAGAGIGPQANILLPDVFWAIPPDEPELGPVVREVTSHEIGHQYFFNLLGVVDAGEAWMSEAFAEYSATRVSEVVTETREHARANYWSYVLDVPPGSDEAIFGEAVQLSPYYFQIVYEKGSAALHALRFTVGADRWDGAMRAWVQTFAGELVTTDDFERFLTDALGQDLSLFFDRWIRSPGIVELVVRVTRGRTDRAPVDVEIDQDADRGGPWAGQIPLRLHRADGTTRDLQIASGGAEVDMSDAQWLEVDPDLTLFRRVRPDPAGDVNLDGVVDGMDLLDVNAARGVRAWIEGPGGRQANPAWRDHLDVDRDEQVGDRDIERVLEQFGAGWDRP